MDTLPPDSGITIQREGSSEVLHVPYRKLGILRYLMAAFLVAWLGGWVFGFTSAAGQLMKGTGFDAFLMFWLAGWTIGGAFAMFYVYRLLRPSIAETFALKVGNIDYDSGIPPFSPNLRPGSQKELWRSLFAKRKRRNLRENDLRTLKLRETDYGNRLTVDVGVERLDLASGVTEVEREWLFRFLADRYSI